MKDTSSGGSIGGRGICSGVGTTFFDDQCFYIGTYGWKHPLFYLGLEHPPPPSFNCMNEKNKNFDIRTKQIYNAV